MINRRVSSAEAAERLGVKPATLYAYVSRGLLHPERSQKGSSFDLQEVVQLARSGRNPSRPGRTGPRRTGVDRSAGDPVFVTELTFIDGGRLHYRGQAVDQSAGADGSDLGDDQPGGQTDQAEADQVGADQAVDQSAAADSLHLGDDDRDGDGEDEGESAGGSPNWREAGIRKARRADAFMNMLAAASTGAGGRAAGDDRYMLHVVKVIGGMGATLINGEPVARADLETIACDCTTVTHSVSEQGEPLHLGRKTREWSTAQRRAVNVRDGGHCRFPGCQSPYVDIHHIQWWEHQGPTDIDNAMNCCRHHHTLIHRKKFDIDGNPNGELRFSRNDGTPIGSTFPAIITRQRLLVAS